MTNFALTQLASMGWVGHNILKRTLLTAFIFGLQTSQL